VPQPAVNSQQSTTNPQLQQGIKLYREGKFPEALKAWESAAKLAETTGDNQGLIRALVYQNQVLRDLGRYGRAKEILAKVKDNLEKLSDPKLQATGWLSLGDTLLLVGDVKEAEEALQKSLKIAQEQNSPQDIAAAQLSLGNLRRWQLSQLPSDTAQATKQTTQQQALDFYRDAAKQSTSPITKIRAQLNELRLLVEISQVEDAQKLASQIQAEIDKLPRDRATVEARINLAESLIKLVEKNPDICREQFGCPYNDAARLLAAAVADAKSLGDRRAQSYALGNLAAVYEKTGQLAEAERLTRQALFLAQANNATDIAYRWQWQLGRLLASQETPDTQEAIAAYTQAIQNLQSIRGDLVATNRDVQFSFQESVEPVYRQLIDLLASKDATPENLQQALGVIESLQVAELDNFFREACLGGREVQIDEIDSQAAVIYPIILPAPADTAKQLNKTPQQMQRLEVIVSVPGQELRRYPNPQLLRTGEMEDLLVKLRQIVSLERRGLQAQPIKPEEIPSPEALLGDAQKVYDWIIKPAVEQGWLEGVKTLVFVLDGPLLNLPMAVLHDGKQYLVENYAIAIAPGLQLIDPQRLVRGRITAFLGGLSEKNDKFPGFAPLPNVEKELQQIQSVVSNSKELLNEKFKEAEVQKEINTADFRVVHLATHGQFSSDPADTFILTWDERINVKELKELLQKRELNAPTAIELLVLSACETAKGDPRAALGLAGVALRAGARSTLATLWAVNDPATASLMANFYSELSKNPNISKAEALQSAQLQLLKEDKYKHPYYWAPFVLVGNWL
jgi:CHAT domain-containing protein